MIFQFCRTSSKRRTFFLYVVAMNVTTMVILLLLPHYTLSFSTPTVKMSPLSLSAVTGRRTLTSTGGMNISHKHNHPCRCKTKRREIYSTTDEYDITEMKSASSSWLSNYEFDKPIPNSIPDEEALSKATKLEKEFFSMMAQFSQYTPKDIASISRPSYRVLYEGVAAGSNEPLVMNAFSVIFNDLMPIRVAGRMIFNRLKNVMDKNIKERIEQEQRVQNETGLSIDAIDDGRKTFMAALGDNKDGDEGRLTMTELIESGIVEMVVELMEYDSFDAFVSGMEQDDNEKIDFEKFMLRLQKCALMKNSSGDADDGDADELVFCDISCDLEEVLSVVAQRIAPIEAKKEEMTVSERKKKYSDRYDAMVKTFEEWETLVPSGDGRMIQVLTGCFAGAKSEPIVNALKIVYMDYSALRVGGDLVFKLMGKLVNSRKKTK